MAGHSAQDIQSREQKRATVYSSAKARPNPSSTYEDYRRHCLADDLCWQVAQAVGEAHIQTDEMSWTAEAEHCCS